MRVVDRSSLDLRVSSIWTSTSRTTARAAPRTRKVASHPSGAMAPSVDSPEMDDLLLKLAFARGGGHKQVKPKRPAWNDAVEAVVSAYGGKKRPAPPKQAPSRWKPAPRPGRKG